MVRLCKWDCVSLFIVLLQASAAFHANLDLVPRTTASCLGVDAILQCSLSYTLTTMSLMKSIHKKWNQRCLSTYKIFGRSVSLFQTVVVAFLLGCLTLIFIETQHILVELQFFPNESEDTQLKNTYIHFSDSRRSRLPQVAPRYGPVQFQFSQRTGR